MIRHSLIITAFALALCSLHVRAQEDARESYESFRRRAAKEYSDFRAEANRRYATFLEKAWDRYKVAPGLPRPEEEEVAPVRFDRDSYRRHRDNLRREDSDGKGGKRNKIAVRRGRKGEDVIIDCPESDDDLYGDDREILIEEVIPRPDPQPQPVPVAPVPERDDDFQMVTVPFYGLKVGIRCPKSRLSLASLEEKEIARGWEMLSGEAFDNTLRDLLKARIRYQLCDWSYLLLIDSFARQAVGGESDEATLLMAYLFCQSGYKMRLGAGQTRLYMLFGSRHDIYGRPYLSIGSENYYVYSSDSPSELMASSVAFPSETPLSLVIDREQLLGSSLSGEKRIVSSKFPEVDIKVRENRYLMDFYGTYPTSSLGDNVVSRWAMYAATPICAETRRELYPVLKKHLAGKTQKEQVAVLLDWIQTGLVYEYDDKVWWHDRAFFADETLYYPYADCEDRSILLSVLVRDLVGLKCALVYYPNHLATAVRFTDKVAGDYLLIDGERYVITDATYIGADVGATMPGMDNKTAKVIVL